MAVSIQILHKNALQRLKVRFGAEEARAMADRLFEHYLNLSPTQRVLSGTSVVDKDKIVLIEDSVVKLLENIPIQYVLGKAYFMDMEFIVNSCVLIPRPETEEMVSMILETFSGKEVHDKLHILDIGTGSGCISISLKRYLPGSTVTAVDISENALKVAVENAAKNGVEINFIKTDILDKDNWNALPQFDLIVSNPPYVTNDEKKLMQPNVLDHEPHTALFVSDDDPLIFYREIIALSKIKLRKKGSLWFEINEMYADELKELTESQGFKDVNIFFDIHGKSRFLHAIK